MVTVFGVFLVELTEEEKKFLKKIALQSIAYGLEKDRYLLPQKDLLSENLKQKRASFVTLYKTILGNTKLRGCIGSIHPKDILAYDVAKNAFYSAFSDPRFPRLTKEEFPEIEIKISVLTPLEKINPKTFEELLQILRPKIDGLYLKCPEGTATFLPDVWDIVKSPKEFVLELYDKANVNLQYPFEKIEWFRYLTIHF